jgi:hypothetical protein
VHQKKSLEKSPLVLVFLTFSKNNTEFRLCQITGIVKSTEFFLGVNTQNFSSASNREFSQSSMNQVPPRAPFTEEIAIFLLP